jgi:hypothetical protein
MKTLVEDELYDTTMLAWHRLSLIVGLPHCPRLDSTINSQLSIHFTLLSLPIPRPLIPYPGRERDASSPPAAEPASNIEAKRGPVQFDTAGSPLPGGAS